MRVDMKIILAVVEMHCEQQSHQAKVMIAVKVTYKDMTNAMDVDIRLSNLKLRTFAAIDQEMTILNVEILGRSKPAVSRNGSAGSKYG